GAHRVPAHIPEVALARRVVGEPGVDRRGHHAPLPCHHCLPAVLGERLDAGADPADTRRPDEDHRDRHAPALEDGSAQGLEGVALAAVSVALDGDVDEPQGELARALDVARQHDEARARAEDRLAGRVELLDRRHKLPLVHELEERGGLAARDDEPAHGLELLGLADQDRLDIDRRARLARRTVSARTAAAGERLGVQREVALEGEDPDPHATSPGSGAGPSRRASTSRSRPSPRRAPRSRARARPRPWSGSSPGRSPWRAWPGRSSRDRKSTRLNPSHVSISYAVFCLKKKTHEGDRLATIEEGHLLGRLDYDPHV